MALSMRASDVLRYSLVAVWLGTAAVSAIEWHGMSRQILLDAGVTEHHVLLIGSGLAVDAALGLTLWIKPGRPIYTAALLVMVVMTLAATWLQPSLWLHPLGPLLKNLPIAAALWALMQEPA
jgi:hypothetical protein